MADIRLIKTNRGGKGNVFAYVEFVSTKGVERALKLDRTMLSGRPMFVSPFKEKRSGDSFSSASQKVRLGTEGDSGEESRYGKGRRYGRGVVVTQRSLTFSVMQTLLTFLPSSPVQ